VLEAARMQEAVNAAWLDFHSRPNVSGLEQGPGFKYNPAPFLADVMWKSWRVRPSFASVAELEQDLYRRFSFRGLPLKQALPGDLIFAHDLNGEPREAGVYLGAGKVVDGRLHDKNHWLELEDMKKCGLYSRIYVMRRSAF